MPPRKSPTITNGSDSENEVVWPDRVSSCVYEANSTSAARPAEPIA